MLICVPEGTVIGCGSGGGAGAGLLLAVVSPVGGTVVRSPLSPLLLPEELVGEELYLRALVRGEGRDAARGAGTGGGLLLTSACGCEGGIGAAWLLSAI